MKLLPPEIKAIADIASKTSYSRPLLKCVSINGDKAYATNAYMAMVFDFSETHKKIDEFPIISDNQEPINDPINIPADTIKNIKTFKNKSYPMADNILLYNEGGSPKISTTNISSSQTVAINKTEGIYPEIERLFPTDEPKAKVAVDIDYLFRIVNAFKKAGKEKVIIELREELSPVVIKEDNIKSIIMSLDLSK